MLNKLILAGILVPLPYVVCVATRQDGVNRDGMFSSIELAQARTREIGQEGWCRSWPEGPQAEADYGSMLPRKIFACTPVREVWVEAFNEEGNCLGQ